MADMNQWNGTGNLTRDPELKHLASGDPLCNLRIAVNGRKKVAGEWVDAPNYFDVTVFGRQAENAATYLAKGKRVAITGRLQWREWETSDGGKRQAVDIVASDVIYLSPVGDSNGAPRQQQAADLPVAAGAPATGHDDGGDIPF